MQSEVIQAAVQAETSKLLVIILLLTLPQLVGLVGGVAFLFARSRTKTTEALTVAQIDERAKREAADLDERRQISEAFRSVIRLVDNKDQQISAFAEREAEMREREAEMRKAYDEFQRSFITLSDVRTGQLDKMTEGIKQQNETNEVVRDTVTKAESEIRTHAERSAPAIEIVKELPTTLQRIEETLKQLDAQLKAIPTALKNEIEPLMKTVSNLKTEVKELTDEAKRVTDTILPLITLPPPPIIEALGAAVVDPTKTPPPGTLKAVPPPNTPPFNAPLDSTTGEPIERLPQ